MSAALFLLFVLTARGLAAEALSTGRDLAELPIETLLQMEVTTVSRKPEKLSESPAAVFVISQDDLRRSGATSFAEALRLAPGLEVARLDASQWAVSARGFNDVFANKLLVLQDGRSVYAPFFSGVFWDVQGTMLEDVERIEVIRGPGGTLWGANAVNGVINIITRSAKDTQGTLLSAGGGTEERALASVRYGDQIGENTFFRVYGTYFNRDEAVRPSGADNGDSWQIGRWGFRLDWDISDQNLLTLQGDAYRGEANMVFGTFDPADTNDFAGTVRDGVDLVGGHMLARWTHTFSDEADLQLQMYYDRTERDSPILGETRDTFDIDFQHRFPLGQFQDVVWGAGYRLTANDLDNTPTISVSPDHRTLQLFSGFVQDEITLVSDRLRFILGTKLEHNDSTGLEIQPQGRLLWTPTEFQTAWLSVARAVRTPSQAEEDIKVNQVIPGGVVSIYGSRDLEAEELLAYEVGYRIMPHQKLSFDLAAFYNEYEDLRSIELGPSPTQPLTAPPPPPAFFVPMHAENGLLGETYGFEAAATVELTRWWRLHPSYSFLRMQLHTRGDSTDTTSELDEGKSPRHQVAVRSSMDLPHGFSFDCMVRYVDELPALQINSYVELDVRLSWRPMRHLEISVAGQNLLDNQHPEFGPSFLATPRAEIERGVYGKVTWRF